MLRDIPDQVPIYVACGYTDLRKGIDGLASMVQDQFELDPFEAGIFLFCGRRSDRFKALYWDETGFVLLYKRLETGSLQWPRTRDDVKQITAQQYRWLMEGLRVEQPRALQSIHQVKLS